MASKKQQETFQQLEGQLSIWDLEITEKPTKVTKVEGKITKEEVLVAKQHTSFTEYQEKVINKYRENDNLHRIIQYCGGGVGIEIKDNIQYKNVYVNREGKEEFTSNKKSSVLPMDKLLYYKEDLKANELQEEQLKQLRQKDGIKKVIRRKGDENILVEYEDKVISIIPKGWVLEFKNIQVLHDEDDVEGEDPPKDIEKMQKKVKVGDIVKASFGKEVITGEICRVYGPGNVTLNIIFSNGTKHTAIPRMCVLEIIKCA